MPSMAAIQSFTASSPRIAFPHCQLADRGKLNGCLMGAAFKLACRSNPFQDLDQTADPRTNQSRQNTRRTRSEIIEVCRGISCNEKTGASI